MNKTQAGAYGETLALQYLLKKGYTFIARNVRMGHKEIDLILRDGQTIVFFEVKARTSNAFGAAREAVNEQKQRLLIQAARAYLQRNRQAEVSARFDVMEVDLRTGSVTQIENAFLAH